MPKYTAEENATIDHIAKVFSESGSTFLVLNLDDPRIKDHLSIFCGGKVKGKISREHNIAISISRSDGTVTFANKTNVVDNDPVVDPTSVSVDPIVDPEPELEPKKSPKNVSAHKGYKPHKYVLPPFHADMIDALKDPSAPVIYGVGPTGTGKTTHMKHIAAELDMEFRSVNCRRDMDTASFTGDKTVDIDTDSGQNFVTFLDGPVIEAMKVGLDDDGNEIGRPALLVIDEAPMIPSWIAIGFNNLLESNDGRRKYVLTEDGGRVVRAHSGFRIVMLGNTIGRGITDLSGAGYTAQTEALDDSTLDRVCAVFEYGYHRRAEESIIREKVGDVEIYNKIVAFRDAMRKFRREGKLTIPFSTRLIVQLCDGYRVWGDIKKALRYTVLTKVSGISGDRKSYIEAILSEFSIDFGADSRDNDGDFDYD